MTTPYTFAHNAYAAALQSHYAHLGDGEESGVSVNVAGRVMLAAPPGQAGLRHDARLDAARSNSSRSRR